MLVGLFRWIHLASGHRCVLGLVYNILDHLVTHILTRYSEITATIMTGLMVAGRNSDARHILAMAIGLNFIVTPCVFC